MHTTLIALDIPNFGDQRRKHDVQRLLRQNMYELLTEAFTMTGLPWEDSHREDRGDGALIITPPQVCPFDALDPLAHHLAARLRRANRLTNEITRLRLRMAVHTGEVQYDNHGVLGYAVTHLFRLLDAAAFKRAMAATPGADLGLMVSASLYHAAMDDGAIDPDAYSPITINNKEVRRVKAHLWLPPTPPTGHPNTRQP
ncbi:hypothetical protein [Actinomadura violacea]|uniref:Guanylate cyclase domain-containing protein n=1 Tax=Actinomadura violacea TaxID=2819934 RepID=A0ABS3RSZ1_9ACTN|nr:hypothetical protein [Actinomadura violacea]MBO2459852.1 hypothetical protein [Actinomadura violacea]